jgi:hypothetical protein
MLLAQCDVEFAKTRANAFILTQSK